MFLFSIILFQKLILTKVSLGVFQDAALQFLELMVMVNLIKKFLLVPTSGIVQWPGDAKVSLFLNIMLKTF